MVWQKLKQIEPARLYTAGVLLALITIVGIFHHFWIMWLFLGIVYLLALKEMSNLYPTLPTPLLLSLGIVIWFGTLLVPYSALLSTWVVFIAMLILSSFQAYTKLGESAFILPLVYPTIPCIAFLTLYVDFGINALILLLIIVAITDTFAYFGGRLFGVRPFCPTSPKKTLEGVLIGVSCATIIGGICGILFGFFPAMFSFFVAFVSSIASVFGDLYESYLKRCADLKDSGSILPGHGGILDRIDGYLFAVIILYPMLLIRNFL
ncbi:hypothetical protein CCZ01_05660 [Helicobacter monodelphidis]|uniref:phosphatidate cytidylyltransferase n=1 Tax=Helicobacter sp. 15-1451 TaxID=2004995 RepID=UPI000DCE4F8A|nr:phosphatidate cytidylyltransferase [Helicobacter sp. 15-1451]RAX57625.1 hypothetical protein CCZ01_05660 [Helicobacter sp. 15-1451]